MPVDISLNGCQKSIDLVFLFGKVQLVNDAFQIVHYLKLRKLVLFLFTNIDVLRRVRNKWLQSQSSSLFSLSTLPGGLNS